jgi:hypothetical protein
MSAASHCRGKAALLRRKGQDEEASKLEAKAAEHTNQAEKYRLIFKDKKIEDLSDDG